VEIDARIVLKACDVYPSNLRFGRSAMTHELQKPAGRSSTPAARTTPGHAETRERINFYYPQLFYPK
jgi:hypothetical protein